MASSEMVTSFAYTFLLDERGEPTLLLSSQAKEALMRKKKAHKKSKKGCDICKKPKVKCDEKAPCHNCVKWQESCPNLSRCFPQRARDGPLAVKITPELSPCVIWGDHDAHDPVNVFHLELFRHFEAITVPTLSFPEVWPRVLQLAFQFEYLMNSALCLAATHLTTLGSSPCPEPYTASSMALLSRSLADFRSNLGQPLTVLDFLEDQKDDPSSSCGEEERPPTLSGDQLFLLGPGIRSVFLAAWPLFQQAHNGTQSVFRRATVFKPCTALEVIVRRRGLDAQGIAAALTQVLDDPRCEGWPCISQFLPPSSSSPTAPSPAPASTVTRADAAKYAATQHLLAWPPVGRPAPESEEDALARFASWHASMTQTLEPHNPSSPPPLPPDEEAALSRAAYVRAAERLSIMLCFLPSRLASSRPPLSSLLTGAAAAAHPPPPRREDLAWYVLSFPLACYGPVLEMMEAGGDPRGLVLLYHFYRAARTLLATEEDAWWCGRRAVVMEELVGRELRARGLGDHMGLFVAEEGF